jgi:hypothetical protein
MEYRAGIRQPTSSRGSHTFWIEIKVTSTTDGTVAGELGKVACNHHATPTSLLMLSTYPLHAPETNYRIRRYVVLTPILVL